MIKAIFFFILPSPSLIYSPGIFMVGDFCKSNQINFHAKDTSYSNLSREAFKQFSQANDRRLTRNLQQVPLPPDLRSLASPPVQNHWYPYIWPSYSEIFLFNRQTGLVAGFATCSSETSPSPHQGKRPTKVPDSMHPHKSNRFDWLAIGLFCCEHLPYEEILTYT